MKILSLVLLVAAMPPVQPGILRIATAEPVLVNEGAGPVHWLPEAAFRKTAARWVEGPEYVPLKPGPTGLSHHALFDTILVGLDRIVTLAVDLDSREARFVAADLNADGDLRDDRRWPVRKRSGDAADPSSGHDSKPGVHLGGEKEKVESFAKSKGMSWPQTIESGEALQDRPLQRLYRFLGAPNYFLIDRDGTLLASGGLGPESLLVLAEKRLHPGR